MNFQQLVYIIEISKSNSINHAAKNLYLSQTALSSAIKSLEDELGTKLITRSTKGIEFTPMGKEFVNHAASLLEHQKTIKDMFSNADKKIAPERLSVASQRFFFMQHALVKYRNTLNNNDAYSISYTEGTMPNIIKSVCDHSADLGIIGISDSTKKMILKTLEKSELEFHVLANTYACVFMGVNNPMTKMDKIDEEELLKHTYIFYEQEIGAPSEFAEEYLISPSFKPDKTFCCNSASSVLSLIYSTDSYTIGSGVISEDTADKLISIPITDNKPIQIGYVTRKNEVLTSQANKYLDILKSVVEESQKVTDSQRKIILGKYHG